MSGSNTQSSPPMTSTSNTSYDGQLSPSTLRNGESSVTSAQDFVDPPSLQAFRKKHRKSYVDRTPVVREEPEMQRYWNEYDHPEDEEEGYIVYNSMLNVSDISSGVNKYYQLQVAKVEN